ncbi:MAG: hypothetical protein HY553_21100 [Elusimicrobia bacterium]|nr:hypothetical protein [Elusimicrobiota bacterium]
MGPLFPGPSILVLTLAFSAPVRAEPEYLRRAAAEYKKGNPEGFATLQDAVNHALCANGHSVACGRSRYLPGRGPKKKAPPKRKTAKTAPEQDPPEDAASEPVEPGEEAGAEPDPEPAEAAEPRPGLGMSEARAAVERAGGTGDGLKRALRDANAAEEGVPRPLGPLPPGGAAAPAASERLASPRSAAELAVAASGGFGAVIRERGFRLDASRPGAALLGPDGTPATPEQLAGLADALAQEPAALLRRPDFYRVLPRAALERLKRDWSDRRDARGTAFRDMSLSRDGRDFKWAQSCERLSGRCNRHSRQAYYRRGDDVAPEDLRAVHEELHPDADRMPEDMEEAQAKAAPGPAFDRASRRSLYARLNDLFGGLRAAFTSESGASAVSARSGSAVAPSSRPPAASPATAEPPVSRRGEPAPGPPEPARASSGPAAPGWPWLALLLGFVGGYLAWKGRLS